MACPLFLCRTLGCLMLIVLLAGLSGCKKQEAANKEGKSASSTNAASKNSPGDKAKVAAGSKELKGTLSEWEKGWDLEEEKPSQPTPSGPAVDGAVDGPALNAPVLNAPARDTSTETATLSPSPSESYLIAPAEGVFAMDNNLEDEEESVVSGFFEKAKSVEKQLGADEPEPVEEGVIEVIKEPGKVGDPLVDNLKNLKAINKNKTVWIDKKKKQVIMVGRVVQRNAPLEMFVCPKGTKEHESILAVKTKAMMAHAALLMVGAKQGHPVRFRPEYQAATGTPIAIDVVWKDAKGKLQKAKAQDWIQNAQTKKPMKHNWVFAGSSFWKDKETGNELYLAEQGDFICVSNFPTAMLDLPIKSSDKDDALMYQAWEKRIPPLGTQVTIIMKPIFKPEKKATDAPVKTDEPKVEKKDEK